MPDNDPALDLPVRLAEIERKINLVGDMAIVATSFGIGAAAAFLVWQFGHISPHSLSPLMAFAVVGGLLGWALRKIFR